MKHKTCVILSLLFICILWEYQSDARSIYKRNFARDDNQFDTYYNIIPKQDSNSQLPPYLRIIKAGEKLAYAGKNEEALRLFKQAIPYLKLYRVNSLRAHLYGCIARAYIGLNNMNQAIVNYNLALNNVYCNHNNIHLDEFRHKIHMNMCNVYTQIKDFNKSLYHCNNAIEYFKKTNNQLFLAASLGTKAHVYDEMNESNKSIEYNRRALEALKRIKPDQLNKIYSGTTEESQIKTMLLNNLANGYLEKNDTDSAALYLNQIGDDFPMLPSYHKACILVSFGTLYKREKKFRKSIVAYEKGLYISKQNTFKDMEINAHRGMAQTYDAIGNYQKALAHERLYNQLKDSLNTNEDIHKINNLEVKYLTERKDRELTEKQLLLLNKDVQIKNRNLWILFSSLGSLFSMSLLFFIYRNYKHKQLLQTSSMANLQHQQDISTLQAKIQGIEEERNRIALSLHDGIVSQLLAIQLHLSILKAAPGKMIPTDQLDEVSHQVEDATQDLRQTTHNLMPDLLLEQGLEDAVAALCEKNQRYTGMQISFQLIGQLTCIPQEDALTLYRIVQELIQNVLKHARATELTVQLSQRETLLGITIEDNGIGFPVAQVLSARPQGLGLQHIRQRIQMLQGDIDIRSNLGDGTTVYIEIDSSKLNALHTAKRNGFTQNNLY